MAGEFALCLTHDVDRPYKTYQALYYALAERPGYHLRTLRPGVNPYWQFEAVMDLESELDVRSAFYFLNEPSILRRSPGTWLRPSAWVEHLGRYDVTDDDLAAVVTDLDRGGWEVGLHGSLRSAADPSRLAAEKRALESLLDGEVVGGRQHHLRATPETVRTYRRLGMAYDASLGSADRYGFHWGYGPRRPFDDEFLVFPLTAMEIALPDPGTAFATARAECERLVDTAARNGAVMTVLWHPRYFCEAEFPGYRALYRHLIEYALDAGAWVGPPRDLPDRFTPPVPATSDTDGDPAVDR
jgi:hypothetical protein